MRLNITKYYATKMVRDTFENFKVTNTEETSNEFRFTIKPNNSEDPWIGPLIVVDKRDGFIYTYSPLHGKQRIKR